MLGYLSLRVVVTVSVCGVCSARQGGGGFGVAATCVCQHEETVGMIALATPHNQHDNVSKEMI